MATSSTNIQIHETTISLTNGRNRDSTNVTMQSSPDIESLPTYADHQNPPFYQSQVIIENVRNNNGGNGTRSGLPTYEEAINPDAPPPSYDSLFGRVREARKSSNGILMFFINVIIILLGTIGCSIIVGITIVIPICMVVIGAVYLNDCPQSEYIPVYLLVGGFFGVIKQLLHLSTRVRSREEEQAEERLRQSPTQTLINCFMFGWFIIGSYWIYKEYEPNYDPKSGRYCDKTLYMFAFWLITSVYISLGLVTIALCTATVAFASVFEPRDTS